MCLCVMHIRQIWYTIEIAQVKEAEVGLDRSSKFLFNESSEFPFDTSFEFLFYANSEDEEA